MTSLAIAACILAAALLFIGGVILLGLGMWVYGRAIAEVIRAASHHTSLEAQRSAVDSAEEALDEIHDWRNEQRAPTDDELRESARADAANDRYYSNGETDITTTRNEMGEEQYDPVPPDRIYIPDEREEA